MEVAVVTTMMEWALAYLDAGLPPVPAKVIGKNKIPFVKWKPLQTTLPTRDQVMQWFNEKPTADVGIVTGPQAGILVLDVEGKGLETIKKLDTPDTWTVKTARGFHYYFRWTETFDEEGIKTTVAAKLGDGVDFRGRKGFLMVPPSINMYGGRYEWVDGKAFNQIPLANPPAWVVELLTEKPKEITKESGESWLKDVLDNIREGNRNESFTRIAGSLRSRGYSASDIYLFLADKAQSTGFDLQELRTITESVGQYQPRIVASQEAQSVSDFLSEEEKVDWLVPGILAKRSIGFIAGLQETCKTWIAMDLAIEVARGGGHWLGKFPVNAGKVLFVDQERFKGETQRRFKSLLDAKQVQPNSLTTSLSITCGSTTRLNMPHSLEAFKKVLSELSPTLVIVDSFATFHTASENDRTEIQKVLELIKQLRNEFGCTFLFINHEGKSVLHHEPGETKAPHSADMMGSIAVPAAAELVLTVRRKDESSSMVYMTKNSLSTKIEPFSVSVVDLDEAKSKIRVEGR